MKPSRALSMLNELEGANEEAQIHILRRRKLTANLKAGAHLSALEKSFLLQALGIEGGWIRFRGPDDCVTDKIGPGTGIFRLYKTVDSSLDNNKDFLDLTKWCKNKETSFLNPEYSGWDFQNYSVKKIELKPQSDDSVFRGPLSRCGIAKSMSLKKFQESAIKFVICSLESKESLGYVFIDMTMGTGKTAVIGGLIAELCMKNSTNETVSGMFSICGNEQKEELQEWQSALTGTDVMMQESRPSSLYKTIKNVKIKTKDKPSIINSPGTLVYKKGYSISLEDHLQDCSRFKAELDKLKNEITEYIDLFKSPTSTQAPVAGGNNRKRKNEDEREKIKMRNPRQKIQEAETALYDSDFLFRNGVVSMDVDDVVSNIPLMIVIDEPQKYILCDDEHIKAEWTAFFDFLQECSLNNPEFCIRVGLMSATLNVNGSKELNSFFEKILNNPTPSSSAAGSSAQHSAQSPVMAKILTMKDFPDEYRPCVFFKYNKYNPLVDDSLDLDDCIQTVFREMIKKQRNKDMDLINKNMFVTKMKKKTTHGVIALARLKTLDVYNKMEGGLECPDIRVLNNDLYFLEFYMAYILLKEKIINCGVFQTTKDNLEKELVEESDKVCVGFYIRSKENIILLQTLEKKRIKKSGATGPIYTHWKKLKGANNFSYSAVSKFLLNCFGTGNRNRKAWVENDCTISTPVPKDTDADYWIDYLVVDVSCIGIDIHNVRSLIYYGTPSNVHEEAVQLIARVIRMCNILSSGYDESDGTVEQPVEVTICQCKRLLERGTEIVTKFLRPKAQSSSSDTVVVMVEEDKWEGPDAVMKDQDEFAVRLNCFHSSDFFKTTSAQREPTYLEQLVTEVNNITNPLSSTFIQKIDDTIEDEPTITTKECVFQNTLTSEDYESMQLFHKDETGTIRICVDTKCIEISKENSTGVVLQWKAENDNDIKKFFEKYGECIKSKITKFNVEFLTLRFKVNQTMGIGNAFSLQLKRGAEKLLVLGFTNLTPGCNLGRKITDSKRLQHAVYEEQQSIAGRLGIVPIYGTVDNCKQHHPVTQLDIEGLVSLIRMIPLVSEEAIYFLNMLGKTDDMVVLCRLFTKMLAPVKYRTIPIYLTPFCIMKAVTLLRTENGYCKAFEGFSLSDYVIYTVSSEQNVLAKRALALPLWINVRTFWSYKLTIYINGQETKCYLGNSVPMRKEAWIKLPDEYTLMATDCLQKINITYTTLTKNVKGEERKNIYFLGRKMSSRGRCNIDQADVTHTSYTDAEVKEPTGGMIGYWTKPNEKEENDTEIDRTQHTAFVKIIDNCPAFNSDHRCFLYDIAGYIGYEIDFFEKYREVICCYPEIVIKNMRLLLNNIVRAFAKNGDNLSQYFSNEILGTALALFLNYSSSLVVGDNANNHEYSTSVHRDHLSEAIKDHIIMYFTLTRPMRYKIYSVRLNVNPLALMRFACKLYTEPSCDLDAPAVESILMLLKESSDTSKVPDSEVPDSEVPDWFLNEKTYDFLTSKKIEIPGFTNDELEKITKPLKEKIKKYTTEMKNNKRLTLQPYSKKEDKSLENAIEIDNKRYRILQHSSDQIIVHGSDLILDQIYKFCAGQPTSPTYFIAAAGTGMDRFPFGYFSVISGSPAPTESDSAAPGRSATGNTADSTREERVVTTYIDGGMYNTCKRYMTLKSKSNRFVENSTKLGRIETTIDESSNIATIQNDECTIKLRDCAPP